MPNEQGATASSVVERFVDLLQDISFGRKSCCGDLGGDFRYRRSESGGVVFSIHIPRR